MSLTDYPFVDEIGIKLRQKRTLLNHYESDHHLYDIQIYTFLQTCIIDDIKGGPKE